jgi:hypothetical protein
MLDAIDVDIKQNLLDNTQQSKAIEHNTKIKQYKTRADFDFCGKRGIDNSRVNSFRRDAIT